MPTTPVPKTKTAALIVAAGRGLRAGGGVPKQWRPLAGRRVLDWTLSQFRAAPCVDQIALVLAQDDPNWAEMADQGYLLAPGGADRAGSVQSGLQALAQAGATHVLIHDAARPCVSAALITAVAAALDPHPAAAPGLPVTDALWTGAEGRVTGTQDRSGLYAAQTPQGFHLQTILEAHAAYHGPAADDVEVARAAGLPVVILPGAADNLKITTPGDFVRAERILKATMDTSSGDTSSGAAPLPDIRSGTGFDVHRFGGGDHVTLCGVVIPHDRGLQGHSDADVGMHAITDAIYGALAEGDIGRHFPPSEPQWKGADSAIFLRHAVELARNKGYAISNIDCTLICEYPKIGPHAACMQKRLSEIMGLDADRISVKATTSERLGFTGRGEGIAAQAVTMLVAPGKPRGEAS